MPRNLLFLFSDQHSQRVAGAYGDPIVQTPNIDRLANEGVRFDNAYCPSPICTPSRMSMLTGRWPYRQECWTNDDVLRSDLLTWPHALGAAGYDPVLIGRLHAIGSDQLHGYAERRVGDHSPNHPGMPRQSMNDLDGATGPNRASIEKYCPGCSGCQLTDQDVTEAAVQWLRDELGIIKRASDVESLAARVKDAAGVEFVPALTGLGAPHWDPDARGMIAGLTRGSGAAHIARATLEAMALQNVDILRAMERDLGRRMRALKVDGGAAANNL